MSPVAMDGRAPLHLPQCPRCVGHGLHRQPGLHRIRAQRIPAGGAAQRRASRHGRRLPVPCAPRRRFRTPTHVAFHHRAGSGRHVPFIRGALRGRTGPVALGHRIGPVVAPLAAGALLVESWTAWQLCMGVGVVLLVAAAAVEFMRQTTPGPKAIGDAPSPVSVVSR